MLVHSVVLCELCPVAVNVYISDDLTVICELACKITVKLLLPTTIDSTDAVLPETVRLIDPMVITASVVKDTSLYAAKVGVMERKNVRIDINNFIFLLFYAGENQDLI